ncbi:MAG: Inner membrane transport permease YadH [Alphaproteobacteria bacterium MarineAlpha5_Bin12]|nr:multidrug ABC transporter permease [Pelagibacteraceae bacterium]PPR41080.1 MAG: Inner membrane transport permease YadH [Alphaproteobacteria bacterium MarineAlpha5_Bin12]|tara:strand:+ start:28612 stop:29379 length:768 start_codon:yes stop_codon:yes gene_type:complete
MNYSFLPIWTLYTREVKRFIKVGMQTIIGPVISSLLFLAVFSLALGNSLKTISGVSFSEFIAPGLIMMTILQNAFSNSASSIGQAKFQGNIIDILMAPLNNFELTLGYVLGSITRGVICGFATYIGILFFIPLNIYSYTALTFYMLMGSMMMACLGTMVGIWADKWDQQQGIDNFIVLPLTFLSGTFYSINLLPDFWRSLSSVNPFFYNIDGFRYAFIGTSDAPILQGAFFLIVLNILLFFCCFLMFKSGYKLKA